MIGWLAFALGLLGIVHIANGNPQPVLGDASNLQEAGGAVGYVIAKQGLSIPLVRDALKALSAWDLLALPPLVLLRPKPLQ